ncbi:MAG TPA: dihydrodipicolinate reductase C-terminal domain-containing protein [Acidimicrobiales bacterium]|nr:MAG: dihydrodipicolinate reductase [Actinobacteria bacterium 21-73-9]HQU26625.1 dihydrodipicolinate reductase C-terminal domain-containing protein [Acidimicrobiales bacterium]
MRIGLIGFGKTGTAVASVVLTHPGLSLEWVVRRSDKLELRSVAEFLGVDASADARVFPRDAFPVDELLDAMPVDVIVDFSSEDGIDYYGEAAARRGIAIVTAISHYPAGKVEFLGQLGEETAVLWSPNITVGINFLILAAQTLRRIAPNVDVEIVEEHFKSKEGVSGTARVIAEGLEVDPRTVKSIRAGGIVGVHEVLFGFPQQTVRIRHESLSREAFGNGAIFAAERLVGLPPGLYKMDDLLLPFFSDGSSPTASARGACGACPAPGDLATVPR